MRLPFRKPVRDARRVGVSVDAHGVAVARVERTGERVSLDSCVYRDDLDDDLPWAERVSRCASGLELRKVAVTGVVEAEGYQLLLVERPEVPPAEVPSAVRWRVRELLNFPAENAVIDVFDLPRRANRGPKPLVYAVAARADAVQRQVDALTGSGLELDALDIPELCLRNVAVRLPEDTEGLALLHFLQDQGVVTLTRRGVLYLIRRIDTGRRAIREAVGEEFTLAELASGVALEVQRSLDYFESHYDQRAIGELVLGPGTPEVFRQALGELVGVKVRTLDLHSVFDLSEPLAAEQQAGCLVAIGAALRSETTLPEAAV